MDKTPESWLCVDCGTNTAPGVPSRAEVGPASFVVSSDAEIYTVRDVIWQQAGSPDGCLCVGCLEKRLGRELRPKDFLPGDPFNTLPATPRLRKRRKD